MLDALITWIALHGDALTVGLSVLFLWAVFVLYIIYRVWRDARECNQARFEYQLEWRSNRLRDRDQNWRWN